MINVSTPARGGKLGLLSWEPHTPGMKRRAEGPWDTFWSVTRGLEQSPSGPGA